MESAYPASSYGGVRHRTIYHVWCLRGVRIEQSEERIVAPPEEISDEQKLRGLAATQMDWARPNDVPCVILTFRGCEIIQDKIRLIAFG